MSFKLCIKVDETLKGLEMINEYLTDVIEIHLLSKTIDIEKYNKFTNIIFHSSVYAFDLVDIVKDKEKLEIVENQLKTLSQISRNVKFLLHCGWAEDGEEIATDLIVETVQYLYSKYGIPIILENTIIPGEYDRCIYVINKLNNENITMCVDTAHVRAIINQGVNYKEYYKGIRNVSHIHFSYSKDNDGYRDKSTHGVLHGCLKEVKSDIEILNVLNIKDVTICPEVVEEHYEKRVNQRKEILLMKEINLI